MGRGRASGKQTKVARELKYRSHPGTRSPEREPVTADPTSHFDDGDGPEGDGSAGVREPRRPKPLGPMSSAGERPMPEPEFAICLPDPRQ
jgi:hypothetical protein